MLSEIIIALMSLVGTLGGAYFGVRASNKLVTYRIDQLEIKVDKHNRVVERMTGAELQIVKLQESVKSAHHRIDEIREEIV